MLKELFKAKSTVSAESALFIFNIYFFTSSVPNFSQWGILSRYGSVAMAPLAYLLCF